MALKLTRRPHVVHVVLIRVKYIPSCILAQLPPQCRGRYIWKNDAIRETAKSGKTKVVNSHNCNVEQTNTINSPCQLHAKNVDVLRRLYENLWCPVWHRIYTKVWHYNGITMRVMAPQITSLTTLYLAVYPGVYQRKHQSSASSGFVCLCTPHKRPVTRKMFPFDDVIMISVSDEIQTEYSPE